MILLDTDTLALLFQGHARVEARLRTADEAVATTIITRIEVLQGRFDAIMKAADSAQLQRAHQRLLESESQFTTLPIIPIDRSIAEQFERLLRSKRLKKLGRGDLLIASFALAHKATLVTRNLRDFKQVPGLKPENWAD
jgi:tRNA(fMet)-specific endonuclease VapC